MTAANKSITVWEAEKKIDEAQQEITRILTELANETGLRIDHVGLEEWVHEGKIGYTVLLRASVRLQKG